MATIDRILEKARRRLKRLTPEEAAAEQANGALIVDTRTSEQRERDGEIPGALAIDRTVMEWPVGATSPGHIRQATRPDLRAIRLWAQAYSWIPAGPSRSALGLF